MLIAGFTLALLVSSTAPQALQALQAPQAPLAPSTPGTETGLATFQTRCTICHANSISERKDVRGAERAPTTDVLRQMSPERIYQALTTGSMQAQAKDLSDVAKVKLAEFMSSRPMGSAPPKSRRSVMP